MSAAQYAVTAVGLAAIAWVLWYFLLSKGLAAPVDPAERRPTASPHTQHE